MEVQIKVNYIMQALQMREYDDKQQPLGYTLTGEARGQLVTELVKLLISE